MPASPFIAPTSSNRLDAAREASNHAESLSADRLRTCTRSVRPNSGPVSFAYEPELKMVFR